MVIYGIGADRCYRRRLRRGRGMRHDMAERRGFEEWICKLVGEVTIMNPNA